MSALSGIISASRARGGAAAMGEPFLQSFTPGSTRSDFSGYVGYSFIVGGTDITVNALGRWKLSGNTGSRTVKITNLSGTEIASASVDMAAATVGDWAAATITPVTLTAGGSYAIQSLEVSGGNTWYNVSTITVAGIAGTIRARYASNGSATWADVDYIADFMYVPSTFFFE